jgi:hypothetical protein
MADASKTALIHSESRLEREQVVNEIMLDNQLADLTDRILAGQQVAAPDELADEVRIVRLLDRVIAPRDAVDAGFQMRLSGQLMDILEEHYPQKSRNIIAVNFRTVASIAAAVAVVIVAGLLFSGNGTDQLSFAGVDASVIAVAIVGGLGAFVIAVGVFDAWRQSR